MRGPNGLGVCNGNRIDDTDRCDPERVLNEARKYFRKGRTERSSIDVGRNRIEDVTAAALPIAGGTVWVISVEAL